jgi:hypothetical protein
MKKKAVPTPKPLKKQPGMIYDMGHKVALGMKRSHPVRAKVYNTKKGS